MGFRESMQIFGAELRQELFRMRTLFWDLPRSVRPKGSPHEVFTVRFATTP